MQRFSKKHLKSRGKTATLFMQMDSLRRILYNEESLVSLEVARKETRDTLMGKKIEGKSRVKLVGEQRSNLPNDTDVSYYSWL